MAVSLDLVPERQRDAVRRALSEAFPAHDVEALEPGPSGASGAQTFRVCRTGGSGDHFLRVEGGLLPGRNPHQYANLAAAAEAGIAPPVRYVDEDAGILVVPWIVPRPLADFPGGSDALVAELGRLIARVQALPPFPPDGDWLDDKVARLLQYVRAAGVVASGLLDDIASTFERVRAAWRRDAAGMVPAHNDPNANNVLYGGTRLWLIDWETSSPNDPLVDLAVVSNQLATSPARIDVLLTAWRGGVAPDDVLRARLALARFSTQLFAGCMIALITSQLGEPALADLEAPSPAEFERQVTTGRLAMGSPSTMATFAKVVLGAVRATSSDPAFEDALATAGTSAGATSTTA